MYKENDSFDKAFDVLLTEAAVLADENIGKKLEDPEEEIVFSKEHEEKMISIFKRERRKLMIKNISKWSKRCACVLFAVAMLGSISVFSVSAWRIKFLNFVMELGSPNADYDFNDTDGDSYSDDEINMGYVPDGFKLTNRNVTVNNIFLEFKKDSMYFTLSASKIIGQSSIDIEDALIEKMTINGYEAIFSTKDTVNILTWGDDNLIYALSGNVDKNEIIKIAEKINS